MSVPMFVINTASTSTPPPALDIPPFDSTENFTYSNTTKINQVLLQLCSVKTHPHSNLGWWCSYRHVCKALLPFISNPKQVGNPNWAKFRTDMSAQIAQCQNCAIAFHSEMSSWEVSSVAEAYSPIEFHQRVECLIEFSVDRVYPALRSGGSIHQEIMKKDTHPLGHGPLAQYRAALIETFLNVRLSFRANISKIIGLVFLRGVPLDINLHIDPFLTQLGHIPSGLVSLCFHSKEVVQSWAIRIVKKYSHDLPFDESLDFTLTQVLSDLRRSLGLERAHDKIPLIKLDLMHFVKSFDTLLPLLPVEICSQVVSQPTGSLVNILSRALSRRDCVDIVKYAANCVSMLSVRLPFNELFHTAHITFDALVTEVLRYLCDLSRPEDIRKQLSNLFVQLLLASRENNNLGKAAIKRVLSKCFTTIENECEQILPAIERTTVSKFTSSPSPKKKLLIELVSLGATLLNWLFEFSSPQYPLESPSRISKFIILVLKFDSDSNSGWNLLRTALSLDLFNAVHCTLPESASKFIAQCHLDRPAIIGLSEEQQAILTKIVSRSEDTKRIITYNSPLWNAVHNKDHLPIIMSDSIANHEIKLFLDLHRLVGNIEPKLKLAKAFTPQKLKSISIAVNAMTSNLGTYICDCIASMQRIIFKRLLSYMKTNDHAIVKNLCDELPFHATHLACSENKEISGCTVQNLLKMYNLTSATMGGSKTKTALFALKQDALHSHTFAAGFKSTACTISSWGALGTKDVFLKFFQWYRNLLDVKFDELLNGVSSTEWLLGAFLGFLQSWKTIEEESKLHEFQELCCRFFSILRDVWKPMCDSRGTAFSPKVIELDQIRRWLRDIPLSMLDMYEADSSVVRAAWITTVSSLNEHWVKTKEFKSKLSTLIAEHVKQKGKFTMDQLDRLANTAGILDQTLIAWKAKERKKEIEQSEVIVIETPPPKAPRSASTLKKLRGTRIEDHFKPKNTTSLSSSTKSSTAPSTRAIPKLTKSNPFQEPPVSGTENSNNSNNNSKSRNALKVVPSTAPSASSVMSRIAEMRRDHRQGAKEAREAKGGGSSASNAICISDGPAQPTKTKFELLREEKKKLFDEEREKRKAQIAKEEEEKKRKKQNEYNLEELARLMNVPNPRKVPPKQKSPPRTPPPPVPENLTVPALRRGGTLETTECIYSSVIKPDSAFEAANKVFNYERTLHGSFRTAGDFARYWEPLLREEIRASVQNASREETAFFEKHGEPCRLSMIVEDAPEVNGADTFIIVWFELKQMRNTRIREGGEEFHPLKVRTNDVVFLEALMPSREGNGKMNPDRTSHGLVVNVSVERGKLYMKLSVAFGAPCDTPSKGRTVRVSRLSSLVTFQRQVDALHDVGNLPDGILWPILEPRFGWEKNKKAIERVKQASVTELKTPLKFVDTLLYKKELNDSQANAIRAVVHSCGPIFKPRDVVKGLSSNHGGITLIQGPPGTGKTSTIIALLSTIVMGNTSNTSVRKACLDIDGGRSIVHVPPIRILVCAPSNAAVDEIMSRVVERGLIARNGNRACPRVIRVGTGLTKEELKGLELRKFAGIDDMRSPLDELLAASEEKRKENLNESRRLNDKIRIADQEQKSLRARLDELSKLRGKVKDEERRLKEFRTVETSLKNVTSQLSALHSEKKKIHEKLDDGRASAKEIEERKKRENDFKMSRILNESVIVFSTLSSSGHDIMHRLSAPFDVTIVDEAAQCVEPDIIIPTTIGRRKEKNPRFSQLVLVGDPKQLPATVLSDHRGLSARMGCSLFERFANCAPDQVHMLNTQYRMHPSISRFPSQQFYGGKLLDGESVMSISNMRKPFHSDIHNRFGPLTFINTKSAGYRECHAVRGGSIGNPDEARLIVNAIAAMVRLYPKYKFTDQIAVLSPYREQMYLLKRQIRRNNLVEKLGVEVNTVDGIQGREKSIVFVSTVRGANARSIGFTKDERRMNVGLTRAKHSVIVVGNAELLSEHSMAWKELAKRCFEKQFMLDCPRDDFRMFPECRREYAAGKIEKTAKNGFVNKNFNPPSDSKSTDRAMTLELEGKTDGPSPRKRLRSVPSSLNNVNDAQPNKRHRGEDCSSTLPKDDLATSATVQNGHKDSFPNHSPQKTATNKSVTGLMLRSVPAPIPVTEPSIQTSTCSKEPTITANEAEGRTKNITVNTSGKDRDKLCASSVPDVQKSISKIENVKPVSVGLNSRNSRDGDLLTSVSSREGSPDPSSELIRKRVETSGGHKEPGDGNRTMKSRHTGPFQPTKSRYNLPQVQASKSMDTEYLPVPTTLCGTKRRNPDHGNGHDTSKMKRSVVGARNVVDVAGVEDVSNSTKWQGRTFDGPATKNGFSRKDVSNPKAGCERKSVFQPTSRRPRNNSSTEADKKIVSSGVAQSTKNAVASSLGGFSLISAMAAMSEKTEEAIAPKAVVRSHDSRAPRSDVPRSNQMESKSELETQTAHKSGPGYDQAQNLGRKHEASYEQTQGRPRDRIHDRGHGKRDHDRERERKNEHEHERERERERENKLGHVNEHPPARGQESSRPFNHGRGPEVNNQRHPDLRELNCRPDSNRRDEPSYKQNRDPRSNPNQRPDSDRQAEPNFRPGSDRQSNYDVSRSEQDRWNGDERGDRKRGGRHGRNRRIRRYRR